MAPMVPLSEVLQLALGFTHESTEKLTLARAIELVLKSGSDRKAAIVADLLQRYSFGCPANEALKIWKEFEAVEG